MSVESLHSTLILNRWKTENGRGHGLSKERNRRLPERMGRGMKAIAVGGCTNFLTQTEKRRNFCLVRTKIMRA